MSSTQNGPSTSSPKLESWPAISILAIVVFAATYLAAKLGGALVMTIPETVWPLWPGCAVLVSILVLVPRNKWPILLPAGLAGFVCYDLQAGVPISSVAWLILADIIEILFSAWGVSYALNGLPRLNSLKALAKYSFFTVFLAAFIGSSIGINAERGNTWINWRLSFLSEALAFLTIAPAILGLFGQSDKWLSAARAYYLEAAILLAALVSMSYLIFIAPGASDSPALLYSLVPFLIWSALRFGSTGAGAAATIVALISIWGAVRGLGPFNATDPTHRVLFLQLFLFCTSLPFMVLAVLVEERKLAQDELRESEERLRLSMKSGKAVGWEWDLKTGRDSWFGGLKNIGRPEDFYRYVHSEDRHQVSEAIADARKNHLPYAAEFRVVWPDETVRWIAATGKFYYSATGLPERMLGMAQDITQRKQVEQALRQSEADLTEAQRLANVGSWQWDPQTDTVTWSEQLYRITGIDPALPAVSFKDHHTLYTVESWLRLQSAVEEALRSGTPYELDLEMIHSDGTTKWIIAKGEVRRDDAGRIVQLRGTVDDFTDRRRAQEELRKSEERSRLAIQAGKMFAFDWDAATDVFTNSPESAQILGLDQATPVTGRQVLESVHPEDREKLMAAAAGLSPETPSIKISYRMVRHDGTVIWLERNSRAHFDEQGRLLRIIGIVADITERKWAEDAVRQSEEKYRRIVETTNEGIWLLDSKFDTSFVNRQMAEMLGYQPGEMLGRSVFDFYFPEDAERKRQVLARRRDGLSDHFDDRFRRKDGVELWVRMAAIPISKDSGDFDGALAMMSDITERKRAEDALRESAERLRLAVQAGRMFAYEWDATTDRLVRSAESAKILGIDEATPLTGQQILATVHPDDRKRLLAAVAGLNPEKPDLEISYRKIRPDGTTIWVERNCRAHFDQQGRLLREIGIVADITGRKRSEEALQKSEEKFSKAFQRSPMALALTSAADLRYIDVNASFERFSGWRREELIGRTPFEIGLWGDPHQREELVRHVQTEDIRLFEARFRMRDGTFRTGLIGAELIEIDGEPCVLAVGMDITEQKHAEEALRESEERFRLVANTAPMLIWMSDASRLYTYFNDSWLAFTGRPMELEVGNGWAEGIHTEDFQRCLDTYTRAFDARERFTMEYRLRRYDGEYRWVLDIGVPRFNQDGSFAGYIGSCVDVTDRRIAEEALSGVNSRLIEAQERERTRIARELHDDIGQRLAMLTIELEQLTLNSSNLPAELLRDVGKLRNHSFEIASDVQALSHELHSSKLEYLGIATAMSAFCREFSDQQNVEVVFAHDEIPRTLPQDISLCLFRVLQEALKNALKHSGVRHFEVELRLGPDAIHLTVRDLGSGFDREEAFRGHGLGLISMAERVKLVAGRLSIDSQPQQGTTIRASVPLGKAARASA